MFFRTSTTAPSMSQFWYYCFSGPPPWETAQRLQQSHLWVNSDISVFQDLPNGGVCQTTATATTAPSMSQYWYYCFSGPPPWESAQWLYNRAIYESILILVFCRTSTMAVCVKPLHNSYNRALYESILILLLCRASAMKNSAMRCVSNHCTMHIVQ